MADTQAIETGAARAVLPQPEPGLTPQMVIERARALRPRLREQQEEADERGWYAQDIHQAMLDGGLYRLVQPKMFGGYEFDLETFARVVIEIARGHPSSGWCYCLGSSHSLLVAAHWSEEAQRELYGAEGHLRAPHRAPPAGEFRRVEGGYIVSGSWNYSSGAPICTHFIGGAMIPQGEGKPPRGVNFIIPRDKIEILSDWGGDRSLGMRGSGSQTVKITGQFVPDHHIVDGVLLTLPDFAKGTPGARLHGNPMYLGIVGGAYHATFTAILTGTAYAAIDEYEEILRKKSVMGRPDVLKLHDPASQAALGEALALTHAAEAICIASMREYKDQCRRWQETGQPITPTDTLKIWATAQKGCYLACEAVEKLFRTASASSTHKGQRMQRYFRDIQMYLVHPSAQPIVGSLYAQNHLGLGVGIFGIAN
jgi:3-hydroxy-9,10-secoandrosta-1,3,5(10)-triene-9,17-dione monooxygenase